MTLVNIDNEVYNLAKEYVNKDRIKYPTIKNFIDRCIMDKINEVETIEIKD